MGNSLVGVLIGALIAVLALQVLLLIRTRRPDARPALEAPPPAPITIVKASLPAPVEEPVATRVGANAVEIELFRHSPIEAVPPTAREIRGRGVQRAIDGMLRGTPGVALGVLSLSPGLHKVTIPAELIAAGGRLANAAGGGFRGTVVDASGRYIGAAGLDPASAMRIAGAIAIGWQIAAAITGQKFLSEIYGELDHIQRGVVELKEWKQNDERALLRAAIDYAREVEQFLSQGVPQDLDVSTAASTLEDIDMRCRQLVESLDLRLDGMGQRVDAETITGEATEASARLTTGFSEYEQTLRMWQSAVMARAVLARTRCALPLGREISLERVRKLRASIAERMVRVDAFDSMARAKAKEMHGRFYNLGSTIQRERDRALAMLSEAVGTSRENARRIDADLQAATDIIEKGEEIPELIVQIAANGAVEAVWELPSVSHELEGGTKRSG